MRGVCWHISYAVYLQFRITSGSFAKNDLQLKASYGSPPPCRHIHTYRVADLTAGCCPVLFFHICTCTHARTPYPHIHTPHTRTPHTHVWKMRAHANSETNTYTDTHTRIAFRFHCWLMPSHLHLRVAVSLIQSSIALSLLQYVAVCCSVLQCVAVCCSVLQCAAVLLHLLPHVAVLLFQSRVAACLHMAVCCIVMQCVAV